MPLSLEESALVPKERIVPSRMVLVEKYDDDGNRFEKARLTARGDQDPELLSLVRNQQTSAPTVSTNRKVVTLQDMASLGAGVELGDVTGAFLESAEWSRQGGKLFLRQPSGGLPGLHPQQLLEVCLPLYGFNDSPKRWFLEVSNFLRNIGWKSSSLDECVFIFFDPESTVLAGILCLHVDDLLLGGCGTACRPTVNALRSSLRQVQDQGDSSLIFLSSISLTRSQQESGYAAIKNSADLKSATSWQAISKRPQ